MDTRFWGPSGWKLLHLLSVQEYKGERAVSMARFLETIPYILPCKFCRASLTDYYRQHPYSIGTADTRRLNPELDLPRWMVTIHNCVNGKLRKQGLHPAANPSYESVMQTYHKLRDAPWGQQLMLLWDFLFSVAYHHPTRAAHSSPMPDCPTDIHTCTDPCEQNKWNVLPSAQRMRWYRRFWLLLPAVLPPEMGMHWKRVQKHHPPVWSTARSMTAWLWRMRCGLESHFHDPYRTVCSRLAEYSSDCGAKKGGITCRKSMRGRRTRKNEVGK